jgi:hypothetical protein
MSTNDTGSGRADGCRGGADRSGKKDLPMRRYVHQRAWTTLFATFAKRCMTKTGQIEFVR